jgi:putative membrane protein
MTGYIKGVLLQVAMLTSVIFLASCENNQKPDDSKEVAEERNDDRFDNNKQENDAQFLVNVAEINLEEIRLGQLAQQKGQTPHVKELGKMMEDAHSKSQNDLTALAARKNIAIPTRPTDDAQDSYEKLTDKTGTDFDKSYADRTVDGHEDAIKKFEKAADDANDPDIKSWAAASLPDLRAHLNHSIECQRKCDKM